MGYNNPDLRTQLDIYGNRPQDVAQAPRNALVNQGLAQGNALRGMDVANAPVDRANALADRTSALGDKKVMDSRAGHIFMSKVMGSEIGLEEYVRQQPELVGQFGVPAELAPDLPAIQAEAAQNGMSVEQAFDELKKAYTPQGKDTAQSIKIGSTRDRHEKVDGRWYKNTEEFDGESWTKVDSRPLYKTSATERLDEKRIGAISKLEDLPPMKAYSQGWRMEDDGRLYIDAATGAPEKLKPFTNTLGKRANMKIIKQVGEHVDDSLEVYIGLQDATVQDDLKQAQADGMWDKVEGRWSNAVKAWMMRNGISGNSKTFKTIMHMQRMASEQRKTMLGTAVTATELQSILAWMPNAGDSYETMTGKITLAAEEGYEEWKRWLDINKDTSNMAPFYNAWGLNRFDMPEKNIKSLASSALAGDDALPAQTPIQTRGDELEAQGMSEAEIIRTLQQEFPRRSDNKR